MKESKDLIAYKRKLRHDLKLVAPIFAKATIGDFSQDIKLPEDDDELSVFLVGVQVILDAIREKIQESDSHLIRLHQANAELENEKAEYRASLSSIAEGVIVTDTTPKITLINQRAADMLGLQAKEVIGLHYYDVVVTKDSSSQPIPEQKRPLRKALSKGKERITTLSDGLQYVRSDGTSFPVVISASPVKIGNKIIGGISTFRDVTEDILLDRSKTELISIASHQLRTPLTAIKWLSEQLLTPVSQLSPFKQRRKLRQIHESNERMISLVNDLLNVSRIDLGRLSIIPQHFNFHRLVEDILKDLAIPIRARRLKVHKDIDKHLDDIISDPRHVQVVMQNLIGNAVKYSYDNGPIKISAHVRERKLQVTVKDMGCGIPASQQAKIFDKLFRADNARTMASEGSGLGLYVSKAITDRLNGKIWFESVENRGSTFYVTIPLATTDQVRHR